MSVRLYVFQRKHYLLTMSKSGRMKAGHEDEYLGIFPLKRFFQP